jgi:tripartite ATP-independent transporter DctP family solute receptor
MADKKNGIGGADMFERNRILRCLVFFMFVFLLVGKPAMAGMKVSMNHNMREGSPAADALIKFAKLVEERTKGEIKIKLFHAAELGDEVEMFNYMKLGSVELGLSGSAVIATAAPEYGALDMPYLFKDQAHLRRVIDGSIGKALMDRILQRQGIRVLGYMDRAPRHLTTKRDKVVRMPKDLRGIKIRIRQIPVQVEAWRALGASPVPMAFQEVYTALQTGTMDAQENPAEVIYTANLFEVQKNLIMTGHVREVQWPLASDKWFKKLSKKHQKILYDSATEAMKYGDKLTWDKDDYFIKGCIEKGMRKIELTDEERQAFGERVKSVPEKFKGKWKPGLYEAIVKEGMK